MYSFSLLAPNKNISSWRCFPILGIAIVLGVAVEDVPSTTSGTPETSSCMYVQYLRGDERSSLLKIS
jgi:hypothetical protein